MIRQTSIAAYYDVNREVYVKITELLNLHRRGLTDREIAQMLEYSDPNKVRPRRNELYHKGIIEEAGKRLCNITKKKVTTWRLAR